MTFTKLKMLTMLYANDQAMNKQWLGKGEAEKGQASGGYFNLFINAFRLIHPCSGQARVL